MPNNERTRAAAQAALDAYRAMPNFDEDDENAITDLIADLMHLADRLLDVRGEYVADKAIDYYLAEVAGED